MAANPAMTEQIAALGNSINDTISRNSIAAFFEDIIPNAAEFGARLRCEAMRHITSRGVARQQAAPGRAVLSPRPVCAWIPG